MPVKAQLLESAKALGFDDCRVTDAAKPASARWLEAWLARGHQGEMAYLARNAPKRANPDLVLPGARSIVTLAASYHVPDSPNTGPTTPATGAGTVARYARFEDYHHVLGDRLKELSSRLNAWGGPGSRSLWYVDTGPVLERDLAQRAGLGFIGKHTNLISRRLGNWIFLSEILTTVEMEPDEPERNHCGKCDRCLRACPTGAITAPFILDARRCISYLTIELKGAIPEDLRPAIGTRIYGCDDCLEVCPWNRFAAAGRLMGEHHRNDLRTPALVELLALDEAGFRRRFAGTPMLRTKRRGLLRNVCVALGNAGDSSALPALQRAALDSEPLIAEHARWALTRIDRKAPEAPPSCSLDAWHKAPEDPSR